MTDTVIFVAIAAVVGVASFLLFAYLARRANATKLRPQQKR